MTIDELIKILEKYRGVTKEVKFELKDKMYSHELKVQLVYRIEDIAMVQMLKIRHRNKIR